jgi:hypothetical protein
MMRLAVVAMLASAVLVTEPSCHSTDVPPDAAPSPSGDCVGYCNRLTLLLCDEGDADAGCVATCNRVVASRLTNLKFSCVNAATTKADARACGLVCP